MRYERVSVGSTIRCMRKEKNMTIEQLSEAVDKSVSHITQLEEGNRRMSMDLLFALMDVFGTDANTLLAVTVEEKVEDKLSIDNELEKLSPGIRDYLSNTFMHMINEAPTY